MKCLNCGNEIQEDAKFCTICGTRIPRCPSCHRVVSAGMRFCTFDGTPLTQETREMDPEPQEPVRPEPMPVRPEPVQTIPSKKKSYVLPVILVILLVLGIAGVLCYFVLVKDVDLGAFLQRDHKITVSEERNALEDLPETEPETEEKEAPSDRDETQEEQADTMEDAAVWEQESGESEPEVIQEETVVVDPIEYFLLNCDKVYFTKEDLVGLDADMCRIARNGIYARLGRKFRDEELTRYFEQYDWYVPTIEPDDFSDDMLNEYEITNRDLIVEYEEEQGYR